MLICEIFHAPRCHTGSIQDFTFHWLVQAAAEQTAAEQAVAEQAAGEKLVKRAYEKRSTAQKLEVSVHIRPELSA